MARKAIYNYIFTPGASTVGKVIIPDPYKLGDILMITNVTRNTVIYNFADPSRGGTVTYTNATNATDVAGSALGGISSSTAIFSNLNNGYTTIFLAYDTSSPVSMSANDVLQIYVETNELKIRPYDFGVDAVERTKIAAPQSLIDADFEYGMQPTKWVQFATMNDVPMVYEQPGTDVYPVIPSYPTFITGGASTNGYIGSQVQTNFNVLYQGVDFPLAAGAVNAQVVQGPQMGPRFSQGQYTMIIAQGQAGQPNCAAGTTFITNPLPIAPAYGGSFQRSFTVGNTAGWSPGDIMCVVEMQGEGLNTISTGGAGTVATTTLPQGSNVVMTTTAVLAAGATTLSVNAQATSANNILFVETTQFGVWEAMAVQSGTGTTSQVVLRNLWGTNPGNATISSGAKIRMLGNTLTSAPGWTSNANVELMRVDSIDSATQFTVTRSWFNTNAGATFGANSIVFKVNHTANALGGGTFNGSNIEIVRNTTITPTFSASGAVMIVERGKLGTTALPAAGPGSLVVQLTGMFYAGNTSQPRVMAYIPGHNIPTATNANVGVSYISTVGLSQSVTVSNVEGVFNNTLSPSGSIGTNNVGDTQNLYVSYFPKIQINQLPGSPVNINDVQTVARKGGIYSGANLVVANVTSNVGTPSLITVGTVYPHGILPGHIAQVQLMNVNGLVEAGTGQFVVTSTPTSSTFTYVAKANLVVQNTGTSAYTANVTLFPTGLVKHRYIDGGNNIGTNTPSHGYEMTRQTKKYFRYQSGKGIMFTSGTQFNPVFSPANITASGTSIGATITIVTENEHGMQPGANVGLYGINTTGYNDYYTVSSIVSNNSFTVLAKSLLGATQPVWTKTQQGATLYAGLNNPRVVVQNWHGAKIRSGIFDDGNGVFYEYDGNTFWAVKRSSTNDLVGRISIAVGSSLATGDANTRFVDQLAQGDQIVIRGMTHTVVQVVDQTHMVIQPVYRGSTNAQDARYTKISEERTAQKAFNLDRADGTGPSGYVMNLAKMQMVGIQYTWYGAGFVDYMIRAIDGKMIMLHRSKGNNVNDEAYMRTGNLPARYQASNKGARSWLSLALPPTEVTEMRLYDVTEFPTASVTVPVTLQIDNEFVQYTKGPFTANGNVAGLTRGSALTSYILGASRNLYAGSNAGTTNWNFQGMPTNSTWASQAFNPNTNTWVAIAGYGGASTATAYSKDGHVWTAGGALPASTTWVSIAYGRVYTGASFRDYFVAVANASGTNAAYSFDDGLTWTSAALSATAQWSSVSFGYDNNNVGTFIAIAGLNTASTATSKVQPTASSFGTWTAGGALPASQMWTSVAFGKALPATNSTGTAAAGNYFMAVGCGAALSSVSTAGAYTADGGVNWVSVTMPSMVASSVAFGNNYWMAVGGAAFGATGVANQQIVAYASGIPLTWTSAATALPSAAAAGWRKIAYGPIVQGSSQGGWVAISDNTTLTTGSVAAVCSNPAALAVGVAPTFSAAILTPIAGVVWTDITWGQGFFNAVHQTTTGTGSHLTAILNNYSSFVATQLPAVPTAAFSVGNIAYGGGNIVAVPYNGGYANVSLNGGRQWLATTGQITAAGASAPWAAVAYGDKIGVGALGRFVAVQNGATTTAYVDNINIVNTNWTAGGALPSITGNPWQSITFVNGAFIALANTSAAVGASAYTANAGVSWTAVNLPATNQWSSIAGGYFPSLAQYGNAYAVAAVTFSAQNYAAFSNVVQASSTTGVERTLSLWGQSGALGASVNWTSVAYGLVNNVGYFVAVAGNNSGATAYSTDGGRTWTAGGTLPAGLISTGSVNKIVFGENGIWFVINNTPVTRGTAAAYSRDNGVTWTAVTMPKADTWINAVYARDYGQFIAVAADQTSFSSNIAFSQPNGGLGTSHTANTGVRVISVTASPDLNHWGSAVIMDGGFTVDRTYTFTYNVANFASPGVPNGSATAGLTGAPNTVFMMRLAPSISSSLTGELGVKDLINRAQVLLQNMYINIASSGARFLLQGVLNPTNIASAKWLPLNAAGTYLQPSFTQFVANNIGVYGAGAGTPNIAYTSGNAATGGEQLFSIPVSQGTAGFLDLSLIKEITGMVLPGTGVYPNGNEVLAINLVPAATVGNNTATAVSSNVDIQITFVESQA